MKAAVFCGKNDLQIRDLPVRKPGPGEVTVQVKACGVCGTDLHIFEGAAGAAPCVPPTTLGHEFSGVISEIGEGVTSVQVGDRVCVDPNDACGACYYCRNGKPHFCTSMIGIGTTTDGGFAEYCTMHAKQVYKVKDGVSFRDAAMTEPVACCLHGLDLAGVKSGDTVLLIGGGNIGLIMLQLVRNAGAARVLVAEPVEAKREMALKLGADDAFDPIAEPVKQALAARGVAHVDVAIECVGLKQTMLDTIAAVGRGGTAMLFGLAHPDLEIPVKPLDLFSREVTVKASFINPQTQERALRLIEAGRVTFDDIITDEVPIEQLPDVLGNPAWRRRGKVVMTF